LLLSLRFFDTLPWSVGKLRGGDVDGKVDGKGVEIDGKGDVEDDSFAKHDSSGSGTDATSILFEGGIVTHLKQSATKLNPAGISCLLHKQIRGPVATTSPLIPSTSRTAPGRHLTATLRKELKAVSQVMNAPPPQYRYSQIDGDTPRPVVFNVHEPLQESRKNLIRV
jgi:hypothetical protein